jgi:hypothetical protein
VKVNILEYDEKDFMASCVDAYKKACGEPDMKLRKVDSPFISSPDGGGVMLPTHSKRGVS